MNAIGLSRVGGLTLGTALPTSGGLTCECGRSVRGGGLTLRTAWSASVDGAPVSSFLVRNNNSKLITIIYNVMNKICISIGNTQHQKLPIENRSYVGLRVILRKHSFNHPSKIQNHHSSYCQVRLGKVILLRRISDYGYITAPL